MTLQVVDASRAYGNPDSAVELYWDLHLSDPEWAQQLASSITIFEPGNSTGEDLQNKGVVKDSSGNITDVIGMSQDTYTEAVSFGTYQVDWQLYKDASSGNTPKLYTDNFTADGPDGKASGTYYTDGSVNSAKFADVADFEMTMYSNGLAITLTRGTISTAQTVEFDFYASSGSSSPLAVLTLDSSALSTLVSNGTILVQPSDLSAVYSNNSVSTSPAWIGVYFTIDNPNPSAAQQTELVYTSGLGPSLSTSTNDSSTTDPNSDPTVSVGAISKSIRGTPGSSFVTASQGAKPFLPNELHRK
ncbi:MAG TPA: hypothetical protein VMW69_03675, partial [Spirochaetia bacterium]|nr:hypothetical protein [Spirochaetia bacterium]